ncbi:MAG: hypothetical protein GX639_01765 [Fibrobacter sp.]|nr:hypothetical protein [Fibrobacter sp.]
MPFKLFHIFPVLFGLVILLKGDAEAVEQKATTAAIELHNRLVQKIDSLDIVKQHLKRTGENFDEIEGQQSLYVDSLRALKQSIQSGLTQPVRQKPIQLPFSISDIVNPQSSLDWIILITSTIAVLSFIFMIIAIIRTRRKNSRINKMVATPPLKHTRIRQAPVLPATPTTSGPPVGTGRDLSLPGVFDQIKQKMHEASDYYDRKEPPRPSTQQIRAITDIQNEDIETLVFEEYKKGVDIHEISKTFKISADHVSLLLKIKGVVQKKGIGK